MQNFAPKKSVVHDEISMLFLNQVINFTVSPSCKICNKGINLNIFPETNVITKMVPVFKLGDNLSIFPETSVIAKMVPVFNLGDKSQLSKFRSIPLLPVSFKII